MRVHTNIIIPPIGIEERMDIIYIPDSLSLESGYEIRWGESYDIFQYT